MNKRFIGLISVTAIAVISVPSASAFVWEPTDTTTARAVDVQAPCHTFFGITCADPNEYMTVRDRAGTAIKAGEWEEFTWRYGNSSTPISSTNYNAMSTAEKAFLDRVRNPSTTNIETNQLSLWQSAEESAQAKVAADSGATSGMKGATTALFKERAALGLAPKLIGGAAIVWTVASTASLVEKALVHGENKLFGWHIQLKGPFGIFGSWDSTAQQGYGGGTGEVTGVKWKVVTNTVLCGSNLPCQVFDPVLNADVTGVTVGTNDAGTYKLWVLEPFRIQRNNLGTILLQGYQQDVVNDYGCTNGYLIGSTGSGFCSASQESTAITNHFVFASMSPTNTPAMPMQGGVSGSVAIPAEPGTGVTIGQFVNTRDCSSTGTSNRCVSYVMTEAQMEKYLGMKDGNTRKSWAWEKDNTGNDSTNWQGGIDADQPTSTYNPTLTPTSGPLSDGSRDTVQKAGRDGTSTDDANQTDCSATGGTSGGSVCPDPFATGYVVPSTCLGATVSDCVTILQSSGFSGAHVDTTLARDSAVLDYPANTVAILDPAPGATVDPDTEFGFSVNPAVMPIEIPDLLTGNEVATDWETRLTTSGYTGTITYVVLDPTAADPTKGPDAPTFPIQDTTTGETRQPGDRIQPGDDITVYKNPPNVPPVPITPDSSCGCPPLDFTPITTVDLGSKFPFGIFVYAAGIIGDFNVSPQAPDFNLTAQATGMHGHDLNAPYDVNLGGTRMGWLDTYMGYWRTLLSFCMWVGAIWFVGSRLLGFHGTGDPGGGVDEVL